MPCLGLYGADSAYKAYGYNLLPLLLFLASPPLAVLLPNPLPAATPPSVVASKYPFTSLRKSLRLLIDDSPEALEEVENDISFTYSGYAPISVRLVQCVAQKGGVISNPAERERATQDVTAADGGSRAPPGKVQAHPIVGWKGFEDVLAAIPGETIDIIQKLPGGMAATGTIRRLTILPCFIVVDQLAGPTKEQSTTTVVFFLGGCTYTEIAALRWVGRQNKGKCPILAIITIAADLGILGRNFLIVTTGIISGTSIVDSIAGFGKSPGAKAASI